MEKYKRKILKASNWVIAGILSLLGYSSCGIVEPKVEYGMPHADFIVSGKVTDSQGNGLSGVRVTVPSADHHQRAGSGYNPDRPIITNELKDTLYTKENGNFEYKYVGFPSNDSINVKIKFEDIAENVRFETDSTKVTFFSSELKGGSGSWYSGKATKVITVQLKDTINP